MKIVDADRRIPHEKIILKPTVKPKRLKVSSLVQEVGEAFDIVSFALQSQLEFVE